MPTLLTHAIVGAALASRVPEQRPRGRLVSCLVVLSILPDLDVIAFAVGIPYGYPLGHRGLSHSLPFAVLIAWFVVPYVFPSVPKYTRVWWRLWLACALAMASHGLLDALTNGGLGVGFLLPFHSQRYFFPVRPLMVSPIGLSAFLDGPMIRVFFSEMVYVWMPLAIGFALVFARDRISRRPE